MERNLVEMIKEMKGDCHTMIVNTTPHPIVIKSGGKTTIFPPNKDFATRVSSYESEVESTLPFATVTQTFGEIVGLPKEEVEGVWYIVSAMVLSANKNSTNPRKDLLAPNTGTTAIRDENGRIVAVTSFVM
ncbi:MAG: hypothetical protein ACRC92_26240 [Peptostreptococcaceae bacterium]